MKSVLVTGGGRGIGLSFVKFYLSQGYTVIATTRKPSAALEALKVPSIELDLKSDSSIAQLPLALKGCKLDLLIHNSGIMYRESMRSATREQMLEQFSVNTIAPLLVTKALLPLLNKPAKIVCLSAEIASISQNNQSAFYGYRASKTALNQIIKSLSIDLKGKDISILGLHPGHVKTDMTGMKGEMSADEAVARMALRIEELTIEMSGQFKHADGHLIPY